MNDQKVSLIIPDVHHRWRHAEKIISSESADEVIFLGDYFDSFGNDLNTVEETAKWLKNSVSIPNRIHLMGNHDCHYRYPYIRFQCSGYELWKDRIINDIVESDTWKKIKWYHILDDTFLLTHSGFHNALIPNDIKLLTKCRPNMMKGICNYLDLGIIEGLRGKANNSDAWIFDAGFCRGGFAEVGGITWCDFIQEFVPTIGLNQIFGHTPLQFPTYCIIENKKDGRFYRSYKDFTNENFHSPSKSYNLALDCYEGMHYAVWNGTSLKIGNYRDL